MRLPRFNADDHAAPSRWPTSRPAGAAIVALLCVSLLCGLGTAVPWRTAIDVSGNELPLEFRMTRASDGKQVSEADYRGHVVMIYFGYTNCPDLCPMTLLNVAAVVKRLGADAPRIQVLFVAVDPERDTLSVLEKYVKSFGPQVDGLRGTQDELAALAGRYHAAYSVTPATKDHPYEVTHSAVIYVFDATGAARLLIPSLSDAKPDIAGTASDLKRLIDGTKS